MNQDEINSLNMVDGTLVYLKKFTPEWQKEPVIIESVEYVTVRRDKIEDAVREILQKKTGGITDEQYEGLNKAIDIAYLMGKRIKLYAKKTGNLVLVKDVDFAKSALDDGKFNEITDRLWLIAKRGEENLAALAAFKVTAEDVKKLKDAIEDIKDKPAERKSLTGENVESTAAIKQWLKEILDKMNDDLDDEIEALCENVTFVDGYDAVRRTDNRRGRGAAKKEEA